MRYSLADLTRRTRNTRRKTITLRPINPPATQALTLYRETYLPVVAAWEAAIPRILATYARTLAQMTTDSPADLRVEIDGADNGIVAVILQARLRLERWAATFARWHLGRWKANVLAATGVDLGLMIGPGDMAEPLAVVIERNVGLIRSVSDQARDRISDAVFRGLRERRSAEEVGRDIRGAVGMARTRAKRVAADQLVKANASLNDERRRQAGIDSWFWQHSGKLHFRPEHLARDGKLYSDNPDRIGQVYQGQPVRKPPEFGPGAEPFCGCTSRSCLIID